MENRVEINENELDEVVGGALRWQGGKVWPKDNPTHTYNFTDFVACTDYIRENWGGRIQTEETLQMLEAAGLVTRAY